MNCPRCHVPLEKPAYCADCGWTKPAKPEKPQPARIACAFEGCPHPAEIRVRVGPRTPGKERRNWANLCIEHDRALVLKEAEDWLPTVGLERRPDESSKDWRRRCVDWIKQNGERQQRNSGATRVGDVLMPPRQREPGDDDEEIAA